MIHGVAAEIGLDRANAAVSCRDGRGSVVRSSR